MASPYLAWHVPPALLESAAVENRNAFARHFAAAPLAHILETYTKLDLGRARRLIAAGEKAVLPRQLAGVGLELGAGTALLSSALAAPAGDRKGLRGRGGARDGRADPARGWSKPSCRRPPAPRSAAPAAASTTSSCPTRSADFVLELASWHHSDDLERTIAETARVLKKGGVALAFDRIQPDAMTDGQVGALLDRVYRRDFLDKMGYPPGIQPHPPDERRARIPPPRMARRLRGRRPPPARHGRARKGGRAALAEPRPRSPVSADSRPKIGSPAYELRSVAQPAAPPAAQSRRRSTTAIGLVKEG